MQLSKSCGKIFDFHLIKLRILGSYLKLTRKLVAGPRKKRRFSTQYNLLMDITYKMNFQQIEMHNLFVDVVAQKETK